MKNYIRVVVPEQVYFGGDTIYGVVELNVNKPLKSRGVRFLFAAYEFTRWTENYGNNSVTYQQRRVFLSHRLDLAGAPREQRKHANVDIVQPGIYHWPFAIVLPVLTPPSCKLIHGKIEYKVNAYVDIPMAFDLKHSICLHVGGNLFDQIAYTLPTPPIHKENEKKFLFSKGKLKMEVTVPRFHFFMGEVASINLVIQNASKKSVDSVKVSLATRKVFFAHSHSTVSVPVNYKLTFPIRVSGKSHESANLQYQLPADETPTTATKDEHVDFYRPQLVKVYHYLRVRLDVPWAVDLSVDVPITLMRINPRAPLYAMPVQVPTVPAIYGVPSSPSQPPPPSFDPILQQEMHGLNFNPPSPSFPPPPSSSYQGPPPPPFSYQGPPFASPPASSQPPPDAIFQHPPLRTPYQQTPSPAFVAPSPSSFSSSPQPSSQPIPLQKPPPSPSSLSPPPPSSLSSSPQTPPPLPQPPYTHPEGLEPTKPSPHEHLYPVLEGYQYPTNTDAVLLSFGDHHMDDDEEALLN